MKLRHHASEQWNHSWIGDTKFPNNSSLLVCNVSAHEVRFLWSTLADHRTATTKFASAFGLTESQIPNPMLPYLPLLYLACVISSHVNSCAKITRVTYTLEPVLMYDAYVKRRFIRRTSFWHTLHDVSFRELFGEL